MTDPHQPVDLAGEDSTTGLPAISIQSVTMSFPGTPRSQSVLRDVSLEIAEGSFVSLLGPSGCGKSTLLNMVAGFEVPTEGSVLVRGESVCGPGPDRSVVFQSDNALFDWYTVRQNVELPLKIRKIPEPGRKDAAERFLSMVNLTDAVDKYPHQLSGGMRQRLQLARVLANDPWILLMDEPFGALDSQTRRRMQAELMDIWEQSRKTVLFITHDIDEAILLSDRIAVMSRGPLARILKVFDVDLPRPRRRSSDYDELWQSIDDLLATWGR